jgi:hypothetical protein
LIQESKESQIGTGLTIRHDEMSGNLGRLVIK